MKKLLLLVLLLLAIPSLTFGQSGKECYRAFKKMEAKIEVGVPYREHQSLLGDVKLELNMFKDSLQARQNEELISVFEKAYSHYGNAGKYWQLEMDHGKSGILSYFREYRLMPKGPKRDLYENLKLIIDNLFSQYPELAKPIEEGGCRLSDNFPQWIEVDLKRVISHCWSQASKELKIVPRLLDK